MDAIGTRSIDRHVSDESTGDTVAENAVSARIRDREAGKYGIRRKRDGIPRGGVEERQATSGGRLRQFDAPDAVDSHCVDDPGSVSQDDLSGVHDDTCLRTVKDTVGVHEDDVSTRRLSGCD